MSQRSVPATPGVTNYNSELRTLTFDTHYLYQHVLLIFLWVLQDTRRQGLSYFNGGNVVTAACNFFVIKLLTSKIYSVRSSAQNQALSSIFL